MDAYAAMRKFVRHPIHLPVAVRPHGRAGQFLTRVADISEGGLAFDSPSALAVADAVDVELPVNDTRFTLRGTVASCAELPGAGFRVGLKFIEVGQSFRLKLAEQVLRIDELRATLSRERGEAVTKHEAARIWVEKYASAFADLYPAAGGSHGEGPR